MGMAFNLLTGTTTVTKVIVVSFAIECFSHCQGSRLLPDTWNTRKKVGVSDRAIPDGTLKHCYLSLLAFNGTKWHFPLYPSNFARTTFLIS
jgi:hypothetical protein